MAIQDALTQALAGIRQARPMLVQNVQPSPLMLEALRSGAQGDGAIETPLEGFGNLAQLLAANVTERRGRKSADDTYGKARDALTYALAGTQPGAAPAVAAAVGGTPSANGQQVYAPAPAAPADVDGIITSTAEKYGIEPGHFRKLAQVESGFNPKAVSPTGAKGLTQFTSGTWKQYGNGGDPFDAAANIDAAARLWTDNANGLRQGLGREPTAGEIYLAHQQGLGGALALLKNPSAPVGSVVNPKHVTVNGGNLNMTAGEFASQWTSKFDNGTGVTPPDGFGARFAGTGGGALRQPDFSRAGIDPNLWNPIPQAPAFGAQPRGVKAQPGDSTATAQMMPQAGPAPAPAAPADAAPPGAIPTPGGPVPDLANAPPGAFWDRTTNSWYVPPNAQPNDPARMDRETALQVLMDARNNQWNTEGQNQLYDAAIEKLLTPPPSPEYDFHFGTDGSVYRTSNTGEIEQLQGAQAAPEKPTDDMREYQLAVSQGYPGTFTDYMREMRQAGANSITVNNAGDNAWDKGLNEYYVKQFAGINDAGAAALGEIGTLDRMRQLVTEDPSFYSGAWSDVALTYKQALSTFGIDPSAARSMEEFMGLSYKAALDSMGGSLGTGFSNADRDFITSQQANLSATPQGNLALIETRRRIAQRKVEIAQLANDYIEKNGKMDGGFFNELRAFAEANPLFADMPGGARTGDQPPQSYIDEGGDPALWQYLTPEQRALWQ